MPISNEKFKKFKKFLEFQEFQEIPRICEFGKISKNFKSFNTELQGSRFCQVYIQQEVSYFSTFEKNENFDHEKSQARRPGSSNLVPIYIYTVLIRNTQYSKYSKYSRSFQRSIFKGLRIGFKVESWSRRQTPVFITPQRGSAGSNHSKIYYLEYLLLFTGLFEFMGKKITLLRVTV